MPETLEERIEKIKRARARIEAWPDGEVTRARFDDALYEFTEYERNMAWLSFQSEVRHDQLEQVERLIALSKFIHDNKKKGQEPLF